MNQDEKNPPNQRAFSREVVLKYIQTYGAINLTKEDICNVFGHSAVVKAVEHITGSYKTKYYKEPKYLVRLKDGKLYAISKEWDMKGTNLDTKKAIEIALVLDTDLKIINIKK